MKKLFMAAILAAFFSSSTYADPIEIGNTCREYAKQAESVMFMRQYLPIQRYLEIRSEIKPFFLGEYRRALQAPVFDTPTEKDAFTLLFGLKAYETCINGYLEGKP